MFLERFFWNDVFGTMLSLFSRRWSRFRSSSVIWDLRVWTSLTRSALTLSVSEWEEGDAGEQELPVVLASSKTISLILINSRYTVHTPTVRKVNARMLVAARSESFCTRVGWLLLTVLSSPSWSPFRWQSASFAWSQYPRWRRFPTSSSFESLFKGSKFLIDFFFTKTQKRRF